MKENEPQERHLESPVVYRDIVGMSKMLDDLHKTNMVLLNLLQEKEKEIEKNLVKIDVNQAHLLTGVSSATIRKRCTVVDRGFANKALYDRLEVIEKFGLKEE